MSPQEAVGPQTTPQHALERLRRAVVAGELRPGDRIRQEEVAAELGVSVASVREALTVLEQEGQVRYAPRRGYFVAELDIADLEEIYELRRVLETRAARLALPMVDAVALVRMREAAADCVLAADSADVAAELDANRRFHFALLDAPGRPHSMRLIRLLWDATEPYRALYYSAPEERQRSLAAHDRILAAVADRDADRLVTELDAHRDEALGVLRRILGEPAATAALARA
ncbi:MAG TPA: GntR family transcriptional regulator [Solirubrobacterales bacterium]|nr:GntR family transcriptional regulator [Solirubrobacterales bacterium]